MFDESCSVEPIAQVVERVGPIPGEMMLTNRGVVVWNSRTQSTIAPADFVTCFPDKIRGDVLQSSIGQHGNS
jgi:hypothetical protein